MTAPLSRRQEKAVLARHAVGGPPAAEWVLRIATALEFVGHGMLAWQVNQAWLPFFAVVGIGPALGARIMPLIGTVDLTLALLVLIHPFRLLLIWMSVWTFWTALLRPLSGGLVLDFIERGANVGAPLALLCLRGLPKSFRALVR
jgi:hypothetical protein